MNRTPRYLVQTRQSGEAWKTQTPTLDLASAEGYANSLARSTWIPYGLNYPIPRYFEVRVTFKGAIVYAPRKAATA